MSSFFTTQVYKEYQQRSFGTRANPRIYDIAAQMSIMQLLRYYLLSFGLNREKIHSPV